MGRCFCASAVISMIRGALDMADLYADLGCFHEAVHWFEKGWVSYAKDPESRFVYSLVKVGNSERARDILKEVIQERMDQLEEAYADEANEIWGEEDLQILMEEWNSEKQAFETMLADFPPDELPPIEYEPTIKTDCYLFGCGRHGHLEYPSKE